MKMHICRERKRKNQPWWGRQMFFKMLQWSRPGSWHAKPKQSPCKKRDKYVSLSIYVFNSHWQSVHPVHDTLTVSLLLYCTTGSCLDLVHVHTFCFLFHFYTDAVVDSYWFVFYTPAIYVFMISLFQLLYTIHWYLNNTKQALASAWYSTFWHLHITTLLH